jgi:hypothetical protein
MAIFNSYVKLPEGNMFKNRSKTGQISSQIRLGHLFARGDTVVEGHGAGSLAAAPGAFLSTNKSLVVKKPYMPYTSRI